MKTFCNCKYSLFWLPVFVAAAWSQATAPQQQSSSAAPAVPQWTNPLVEQRADPQVFWHEGNYYLVATVPEYDRIEIRRAPTLDGLRAATPKVIWRKHDTGPMGAHIWAPEMHRLDGKWYVYFAAGEAERIWNIRMYALENAAADPFEGEWVEKGEIKTKWDSFALDATVFEHKGQRYLIWAQRDPEQNNNSSIFIAKMDTPTSIVQPQVMLSQPDLEWERVRFRVNEGAVPLVRNGRVFLIYSASATDSNYCMGMLTAGENANLLDPALWKKSPLPVFATWSPAGQYGPGHGSFTTTPDGKTDIMVYHARNYLTIQGDPLRNPDRHTRAQILTWNADGTPNFGTPVSDGPRP